MIILIIDTSGEKTVLAISTPDGIEDYSFEGRSSHLLLPRIKALGNFDAIAIGTGPGAFTGTRIGVMVAKSLSYAMNLPLIPFCSLELYAPQEPGPFTIVTDAKAGKTYTLSGIRGESVEHHLPAKLDGKRELNAPIDLHQLAKKLKVRPHTKDVSITYLRTP
ncbi:MAG: tRNA (adenosine(37)-N6)-threonylcarbamoyltransferase complex dimerization subunit type 1 TsaB [Simkaniaceae bacterium]|nr:tRNA (adenosine(37)-N6)-threonylcarbamoyltransferase complex dimerization subunit type 1 TsaB [Simkaniaceae bacterium]